MPELYAVFKQVVKTQTAFLSVTILSDLVVSVCHRFGTQSIWLVECWKSGKKDGLCILEELTNKDEPNFFFAG
jgi:hypothetical protein